MSDTAALESREAKLNKGIEDQVDKLVAASPLKLPAADAEISKLYVNKIEGTCDVERAKKDTDIAIDLLYIAYNTTPQAEGAIRVEIKAIMDRLIQAQQQGELAMRRAMRVADSVIATVGRIFPDWLDVREVKGPDDTAGVADLKSFLKEDVVKLAREIKAQTLEVKKELDGVAAIYDGIIKDIAAATSKSETALASRLKDKAAIEKEISDTNAKREQLEKLVKDLQSEVPKEIAFFFKSFADRVSQEAGVDIELFDAFVGGDKVRMNAFQNLVLGADKFFLRQTAEWNAIKFVSGKFCESFAHGWSKLNELSGKYITGNELETYLKTASLKLEEIVAEREKASKQKI